MNLLHARWYCLGLMGFLGSGLVHGAEMQDASVEKGASSDLRTATVGYSLNLPGGGKLWASEDPSVLQPMLGVQTSATAAFANDRLDRPLQFTVYSNYNAFIERFEVRIFHSDDVDLARPLTVLPVARGSAAQADWDGTGLPAAMRVGESLHYVVRAYDQAGRFDETRARTLQLVTPAEQASGRQTIRNLLQPRIDGMLSDAETDQQLVDDETQSTDLRIRNIPIQGSRVRILGTDLPTGSVLTINGRIFPADREGRLKAEFIEPVGSHEYRIGVRQPGGESFEQRLQVDVSGQYSVLVALADVTFSHRNVSGSAEPLAGDASFEDGFLSEGRLAFYFKKKIYGRYLFTAQADTRERELEDLFSGFLDSDAQDVFRRLDPDLYYPTFGDDSVTYRDVDTQGRFYARIDWDHNQAVWGNYRTEFTGTEYAYYQRSLYGAALNWRSAANTALGAPRSQLKVFGSKPNSMLGHSEFLGTGGSLYYLRHTDVLPGSDKLVLELRDRTTGRTETRVDLQRGADYEIDELQGRVLLTRPLAQLARENLRRLTRDNPLDGYENILLADYEYVPDGFRSADVSIGLRGKQWLGEHIAIGGTYVDEDRAGADYQLQGVDVTLQATHGTYLKIEHSRSEAAAAPIFFSNNGGLSFIQRNPTQGSRSGDANAIEARADLKALGWTDSAWNLGAWRRDIDPGFSVARFDHGLAVREYGAEFLGEIGSRFSLFGRYSVADEGTGAIRRRLEQGQLTGEWRVGESDLLGAEVRWLDQTRGVAEVHGLLGALSYRRWIGEAIEIYGVAQVTLDDDSGAYPNNDLATVGGQYLFGDHSSLGAELSQGSRGQGIRLEGEYRLNAVHSIYGSYGYSTDQSSSDPTGVGSFDSPFSNALGSGWTMGQRWRLSNQANLFNESQFLKDPRDSAEGLTHTVGMDFLPRPGWSAGFTVMEGELDSRNGSVDRRAYSLMGGRIDARMQWASKLEYRRDHGAEQRTQWVTTNRLLYKLNADWRIAARINYARTRDAYSSSANATLAESNIGFAWRPHDSTRWAAFGKFTYLYDLASAGQDTDMFDQRSRVVALEGLHQLDPRWEIAAKIAGRWGDYRSGRDTGAWFDSRAQLGAIQLRYHLIARWDAMAEYRCFKVKDGGTRRGWLLGADRQLGENFKLGAGYNFTDFSDDLTDLSYDNRGWFLNLTGYY